MLTDRFGFLPLNRTIDFGAGRIVADDGLPGSMDASPTRSRPSYSTLT
jgi:hypothetical protein